MQKTRDAVSFLDILVTLAEGWKILVLLPVFIAALTAALLYSFLPREYESTALMRLSPEEAVRLQSTQVLDSAIAQTLWLPRHESSLSAARAALTAALSVEPISDTSFYRLAVVDSTGAGASELLSALVQNLIRNSQPVGDQLITLQARVEGSKNAVNQLDSALTLIMSSLEGDLPRQPSSDSSMVLGNFGESVAALVKDIESFNRSIVELQLNLDGSVSEDDVLQPATIPDRPLGRNVVQYSITFGLFAFMASMLLVWTRALLRQAATEPENDAKIVRIRRALTIYRRPAKRQEAI